MRANRQLRRAHLLRWPGARGRQAAQGEAQGRRQKARPRQGAPPRGAEETGGPSPHFSPGFVARRCEGAQIQGARRIRARRRTRSTSSTRSKRNAGDARSRDAAAGSWW